MNLFIVGIGLLVLRADFVKSINCYASEDEPFESTVDETVGWSEVVDEFRQYNEQRRSRSNDEFCRFEIYIDHQAQSISINYGDSFQWTQFNADEVRLDFLVIFDENESNDELYSIYEYSCSNDDNCHVQFIDNHLERLLALSHRDFHSHIRRTIVHEPHWSQSKSRLPFCSFRLLSTKIVRSFSDQSRLCFVDKNRKADCLGGLCLGKYSTFYENSYFDCHQSESLFIEFHVTIDFHIDRRRNRVDFDLILRFLCSADLCNEQKSIDELFDTVRDKDPLINIRNDFLIDRTVRTTTTGSSDSFELNSSSSEEDSSFDELDDFYRIEDQIKVDRESLVELSPSRSSRLDHRIELVGLAPLCLICSIVVTSRAFE